jgi:hypothetical protein
MSSAAGILLAGSILVGVILLIVVWYVLQVIAYWKIFTKAGIEGWKSLIPFYNTYYEYKLSWKTEVYWPWLACMVVTILLALFGDSVSAAASASLTGLCQTAAFILGIIQSHKLSKSFGHGVGFTIGLIILNPIFKLILAFGSNEYQGPQA